MDRPEIKYGDLRYRRLETLSLSDFKRFLKYIPEMGYTDLSELLEQGAQRLFDSEKIYLFLALLFVDSTNAGAFTEEDIRDREDALRIIDEYNHDLDAKLVGEAITFFFEKLIGLSHCSQATFYLLLRSSAAQSPKPKAATRKKKSTKKSTGRTGSKRSRSKSATATSLSIVHSKTQESNSE